MVYQQCLKIQSEGAHNCRAGEHSYEAGRGVASALD